MEDASIKITLQSLKNEILKTINSIKDDYVDQCTNGVTEENRFKITARNKANQIIYNNVSAYISLDDDTKIELQEYINITVESKTSEYLEECKSKKNNGIVKYNSNGFNNNVNGCGYDYDPYTENGISKYPITREYTTTDTSGNAVKIKKEENRVLSSIYHATNSSYSGADIVATINITPNGDVTNRVVATLGELQTISYSIYQDKKPIRVLGNMNVKDWVFGPRTIAGSLVFATFNRHWLMDIYNELKTKAGIKNWHYISDEIPPFTITLSFANEAGYDSKMVLYGVRLMNEGQTMSTNDIYIENTYQFVATDIDYLDSLSSYQRKYSRHNTTTITQQYVENTATYDSEPSMISVNDNQTVTTVTDDLPEEEWKNHLNITSTKWKEYLENNSSNIENAKKEALETLKTRYDRLRGKYPDKKSYLKELYEAGCNSVNDFVKQSEKEQQNANK